jgi:hypothetical protein
MGDDVDIQPSEVLAAAGQLRQHAAEVESHGQALEEGTQASVGHGAIGEVIDQAVKRGVRAVAHGITGAVKKLHEDTALGLEKAARRTMDDDARARSAFEDLERGPHEHDWGGGGHGPGGGGGGGGKGPGKGRAPSSLLQNEDGVPGAGPGTKRLGTLDEGVVTRDSNGLITHVDGSPADAYLRALSVERRGDYRAAQQSGAFPRKRQGEAVAVGLDRRSGAVYEGINGKDREVIPDEQLHPTLRDNLQSMHDNGPYDQGDGQRHEFPHPSTPLSHAEVKATNQALWDRREAGLPDGRDALKELTVSPDFTFMGGGRPAPFCANCHRLLPGVHSVTGRLTQFPPEGAWMPDDGLG